MTKIVKSQTSFIRIRVLDFPIRDFFVSAFVSGFDIRISDLSRWLLGASKVLEVVLSNSQTFPTEESKRS